MGGALQVTWNVLCTSSQRLATVLLPVLKKKAKFFFSDFSAESKLNRKRYSITYAPNDLFFQPLQDKYLSINCLLSF